MIRKLAQATAVIALLGAAALTPAAATVVTATADPSPVVTAAVGESSPTAGDSSPTAGGPGVLQWG
ncbi:ABC-type uncharacterized transport system substrate-binding protein [Kitasatospora sp. MAA4]|uniref:hypothetical protein n=1 Tax=Kitasatospora sp. MAA4 TaxID=3035093 RepID=UPI0024741476|nr:hypothetical protein [Kitasatospora sp. MAA4]MDH6134287.1 ABC-type uncharacterized transport system substrate-binding protein [Kitasatospora sp. MAA4]